MRNSIFYYKQLTPAEVGNAKTHEVYVRMPNDFDYESFFKQKGIVNASVIEVNFSALDTTNSSVETEALRFVYYVNAANREKRLPGLRSLFEKHNVKEGDFFGIESRTENGKTSFIIKFYPKGSMVLQPIPPQICFSRDYEEDVQNSTEIDTTSLQRIYYGAPGTGKSHEIKTETAGNIVVRTTFHPDSDYSTFVGCYKPTTDPVYDRNGNKTTEEKITYRFSEQAFFQAYTKAWEELQKPAPKPVFLIIEEINRGNCAQIFGDLFQLLDRCQIGYSEYPIVADFDMNKQLFGKFEQLQLDDHIEGEINKLFAKEYPNGIVPLIQKGKLLLLPKNLYIWATMNTSDQSLFPIDSAFKRRWEWRYVKINKPDDKDWELQNGTKWWDFIQKINYIINKLTSSADKQLGYFFAKADDDKTITNDKFVSKVCFYLWNDIFKTYATDDLESSLFKFDRQVGDTTQPAHLTFPDFYDEKGKVIDSVVERFIQNVMSYEVL